MKLAPAYGSRNPSERSWTEKRGATRKVRSLKHRRSRCVFTMTWDRKGVHQHRVDVWRRERKRKIAARLHADRRELAEQTAKDQERLQRAKSALSASSGALYIRGCGDYP